jgi:hypothetical protein
MLALSQTGSTAPSTDAGLTYNASTNRLGVTGGVNPNSSGGTALTNLDNSTYTPTLTNTTNIAASTAAVCQYFRINDMVTICGRVDIDPTAAAAIELRMSLPIASSFTSDTHAGGVAFCTAIAGQGLAIAAETSGTNTLKFVGIVTDVASRQYAFTVTYRIR